LQRAERYRDSQDGAIVGRQIVVPLGEDIAALAGLGGLDLGEQGLGGANDLEGVVQSLAIGIRFRREAEDQPATDGEEKHEEDESPQQRLLHHPHAPRHSRQNQRLRLGDNAL
jgi:hypothetical protein